MRKRTLVIVTFILVSVGSSSAQYSDGADRTISKPLPSHPGNIFLAGEEVVVPLPSDWAGMAASPGL